MLDSFELFRGSLLRCGIILSSTTLVDRVVSIDAEVSPTNLIVFIESPVEQVRRHVPQLGPGDDVAARWGGDTDLASHRERRRRVVTRHHHHTHAGFANAMDRWQNLRS